MAQRLLRVIVPGAERDALRDVLSEHGEEVEWVEREGDDAVAVEAIIAAEGTEPLLDALEEAFGGTERFRMVLLPVAATIPRPEEEGPEEAEDEAGEGEAGEAAGGGGEPPAADEAPGGTGAAVPGAPVGTAAAESEGEPGADAEADGETAEEAAEEGPQRISREELYSDVTDISGTSSYYLVMVALSAIVASVGIVRNSPAVIIGAMVIAPLLGPNMALSLATTLGDVALGREAIRSTAAGVAVAFAVSAAWGLTTGVDPTGPEVVRLTTVGYGEIVLALAAGAAGVLSLTRGTATALVGVMVAVALLPPLVACGLLLGAGHVALAGDAAILVGANVVCINLAGVVAFLAQGLRPRRWWEADRARKATTLAIVLWVALLVGMVLVIGRARGDW